MDTIIFKPVVIFFIFEQSMKGQIFIFNPFRAKHRHFVCAVLITNFLSTKFGFLGNYCNINLLFFLVLDLFVLMTLI